MLHVSRGHLALGGAASAPARVMVRRQEGGMAREGSGGRAAREAGPNGVGRSPELSEGWRGQGVGVGGDGKAVPGRGPERG